MDVAEVRTDISALEETAYFNWGASGPCPRHVVEAATSAIEDHAYQSPGQEGMYPHAFGDLDDSRAAIADWVGQDASDIALTTSTMDGIARVAAALDWNPGDTVVRTDVEHPAGVLPWERLAEIEDIDVSVVPTTDGRLDRDAYRDAVTEARLVAVSAVSWTTGVRFPISELVDIAHDSGATVLIDAVQAPGQIPFDIDSWGADFVAGAGHKWLMAPWGAGFLYGDPVAVERLEPPVATYRGVQEPKTGVPEFRAGMRRLELGTMSHAPHAGLREALSILDSVGIETITKRIDNLTARIRDAISPQHLVGPAETATGLVPVRVEDASATVQALAAEDTVVRSLPIDEEVIRLSVHAYNTEEEVDQACTVLQDHLR
jgi:cysteine desulfurase/selenocysteine lyase